MKRTIKVFGYTVLEIETIETEYEIVEEEAPEIGGGSVHNFERSPETDYWGEGDKAFGFQGRRDEAN